MNGPGIDTIISILNENWLMFSVIVLSFSKKCALNLRIVLGEACHSIKSLRPDRVLCTDARYYWAPTCLSWYLPWYLVLVRVLDTCQDIWSILCSMYNPMALLTVRGPR